MRAIATILFILISTAVFALEIIPIQATNAERLKLIADYAELHYGTNTWRLSNPRAIVFHDTENDSLRESRSYFSRNEMEAERSDLLRQGRVNVGIHYFIDKDGSVYSFYPESVIARHTIGYNYTAIGIEAIGLSGEKLTDQQLESGAALIADIVSRHPSIRYLFGHHEAEWDLPHRALRLERVPDYRTQYKKDPGPGFMTRLRKRLFEKYDVQLEE